MVISLSRPRLLARLNEASDAGLVVLTAPAGFGKTLAVEQWAEQHHGPVMWVRVGHGDAPPLPERTPRRVESSDAEVLVIDGLDSLGNPRVEDALVELAALVCRRLRVVVTRRGRHCAALNRLMRSVGAATIDEHDLAFTPLEAQRFLCAAAGGDVESRFVDALMQRTEGWPFALRIAATGLERGEDPEHVVDSISGANRHIASLFFEDVLRTQPSFVRRFVIGTSILDRLTGSLCDLLLGTRCGAVTLALLARRGVFTFRASANEAVFRYHPLFREAMRRELRLTSPGAEPELLRRAATWCARHDDPDAAVGYLAQTGEWDSIIDLADAWGRVLFERGDPNTLCRWLDGIPRGAVLTRHDRRLLALRRIVVYSMLGRSRLAQQAMHDLGALSPAERVICDTLRASWMFSDAQPDAAATAAEDALAALEALPPSNLPDLFGMTSANSLRIVAAGSRGRSLWALGDLDGARAEFRSILSDRDGYAAWQTHALSSLAILEAWAGNLSEAQRWAHAAHRRARQGRLHRHPATIDAYLASAHVMRERGHVDRAKLFLDEAHLILVRFRRPIALAVHATELALVCLSAGKIEQGIEVITSIRASGEPPLPPMIDARLTAAEIALLVAHHDAERAQSLLPHHPGSRPDPIAAVAVRAALARRDIEAARAELDAWQPTSHDPRPRAERELLAAIVELESGSRRQALRRARDVVEATQADGSVALFADIGDPAERLLRALVASEKNPDALRILRYLSVERHATSRLGLSDRELDVVRYLPGPLSNAEIAAQLFISLNTLKTHLRTIYRKLGVSGRRDAIHRAEELGLA